MNLKSPSLIGFGIHDKNTRDIANQYCNGVIVGSSFIRALEGDGDLKIKIKDFLKTLK